MFRYTVMSSQYHKYSPIAYIACKEKGLVYYWFLHTSHPPHTCKYARRTMRFEVFQTFMDELGALLQSVRARTGAMIVWRSTFMVRLHYCAEVNLHGEAPCRDQRECEQG